MAKCCFSRVRLSFKHLFSLQIGQPHPNRNTKPCRAVLLEPIFIDFPWLVPNQLRTCHIESLPKAKRSLDWRCPAPLAIWLGTKLASSISSMAARVFKQCRVRWCTKVRQPRPGIEWLDFQKDDLLLCCSDGVWEFLSNGEALNIVSQVRYTDQGESQ